VGQSHKFNLSTYKCTSLVVPHPTFTYFRYRWRELDVELEILLLTFAHVLNDDMQCELAESNENKIAIKLGKTSFYLLKILFSGTFSLSLIQYTRQQRSGSQIGGGD
jgi:hypothetical protein